MVSVHELSAVVCWTRMQAEAGQALADIIRRKEIERVSGNGLFSWGVGNAPGGTATKLARLQQPVDVVFSIMKSRPKPTDATPDCVTVWRKYIDMNGSERPLPEHMLVTSRSDSVRGPKRVHYALMCRSERPLSLQDYGPFDPTAFRNVGGRGAPVGASQVTAFLQRTGQGSNTSTYRVNLAAELAESYWVKLVAPIQLSPSSHRRLPQWLGAINAKNPSDWLDLVANLRQGKKSAAVGETYQATLL